MDVKKIVRNTTLGIGALVLSYVAPVALNHNANNQPVQESRIEQILGVDSAYAGDYLNKSDDEIVSEFNPNENADTMQELKEKGWEIYITNKDLKEADEKYGQPIKTSPALTHDETFYLLNLSDEGSYFLKKYIPESALDFKVSAKGNDEIFDFGYLISEKNNKKYYFLFSVVDSARNNLENKPHHPVTENTKSIYSIAHPLTEEEFEEFKKIYDDVRKNDINKKDLIERLKEKTGFERTK